MQLGMIGLGRMGANMVVRLIRAGHECVVYARRPEVVKDLESKGAVGTYTIPDFIKRLSKPRVVWLMLPAASVDAELAKITPLLEPGDIVVDGGNSYYHDDINRAAALKKLGLHYIDIGVSGGVWGLERGYCQMIGGDVETVQHLDPIFKTLAPGVEAAARTPGADGTPTAAEMGYLHCGPHGAGHFVKMVHNGIEYAMMAAFAEGLNIIRGADAGMATHEIDAETTPQRHPEYYQYKIDIGQVAELWRRGSVVGSWLLDLTASALRKNPTLSDFSGHVSDSGEGRWTLLAAIDEGVPAPAISAALFSRFSSRGNADFGNKILSAMRFEFGGHHEKPAAGAK